MRFFESFPPLASSLRPTRDRTGNAWKNKPVSSTLKIFSSAYPAQTDMTFSIHSFAAAVAFVAASPVNAFHEMLFRILKERSHPLLATNPTVRKNSATFRAIVCSNGPETGTFLALTLLYQSKTALLIFGNFCPSQIRFRSWLFSELSSASITVRFFKTRATPLWVIPNRCPICACVNF